MLPVHSLEHGHIPSGQPLKEYWVFPHPHLCQKPPTVKSFSFKDLLSRLFLSSSFFFFLPSFLLSFSFFLSKSMICAAALDYKGQGSFFCTGIDGLWAYGWETQETSLTTYPQPLSPAWILYEYGGIQILRSKSSPLNDKYLADLSLQPQHGILLRVWERHSLRHLSVQKYPQMDNWLR